jgi:hypothetical protein
MSLLLGPKAKKYTLGYGPNISEVRKNFVRTEQKIPPARQSVMAAINAARARQNLIAKKYGSAAKYEEAAAAYEEEVAKTSKYSYAQQEAETLRTNARRLREREGSSAEEKAMLAKEFTSARKATKEIMNETLEDQILGAMRLKGDDSKAALRSMNASIRRKEAALEKLYNLRGADEAAAEEAEAEEAAAEEAAAEEGGGSQALTVPNSVSPPSRGLVGNIADALGSLFSPALPEDTDDVSVEEFSPRSSGRSGELSTGLDEEPDFFPRR